jgi:hypothetical protein
VAGRRAKALATGRLLSAAMQKERLRWVPVPGSPGSRTQYLPPPSAIVSQWLQGGLVLAIVSALGAMGTHNVFNASALLRLATFGAPDESAALPNVLVYMLCGLVLVGLAQLSRLRPPGRDGGGSPGWASGAGRVRALAESPEGGQQRKRDS